MKYVVSRNFAHLFEHAEVDREVKIGDTGRIADVCAEFDHPQLPLGRGVIGEVQYRNTSKDIEVVTEDYLRAGYSVYWIDETDFGEDYRTFELPEIVRAWPNALQSANEWSGYEEPVVEIRSLEPAQYPIPLRMPPEFMEKHREELRDYWKLGAGELDYDIIRRLTYNNADRRCSTCGESADYYLYKDGIFNDFRCVKHASVDEDSK
ncbi:MULTISPECIES: hypothetical protein [unclassified Haloferax]|uniref:hypothetical protein n=1 Tax=unclassified Haloferax TaxID=2625095 RepID=UPI002874ECD7|nr:MULTISPECIES: hypothetical protein [unclassified Haloferax]MDS0243172.1 hypothetical protein [Haloferax sp. S2CR25]MDS0446293.1 hypothetical protein [Haloferax sp. S2CR25-2]